MGFLDFINDSKTAFHAAKNIGKTLEDFGFKRLYEYDDFKLEYGSKYYIVRNSSSVLAFTIPNKVKDLRFNITAAHLDSPTFKLKPNFELNLGRYQMLNTEVYGGAIFMSWLDRPLDIAGRVFYKENGEIKESLISFDKGMCMIPNLSIHYNRDVNRGINLNPQAEMLPIFADNDISYGNLNALIAKKLNIEEESIISHDLYLALLDRGSYVGANDEFIMAPQIDNLECAYALTEAIVKCAYVDDVVNVMALFDSEEIGSKTRSGADSDMLENILKRISNALNLNEEEYFKALARSYFISADNAQGFHPSYANKYDPTNRAYLNEGIVIKSAARGSYTTDGYSMAIFKELCDMVSAKYQLMTNRSDMPGGSTLGAISLSHVSIPSVDIGYAELSMHSAYETAGSDDIKELINVIRKFYSVKISFEEGKVKIIG